MATDPTYNVGDIVRLVVSRGSVSLADAGRIVTVRAFSGLHKAHAVRVDNGDPANADMHTNGMTYAAWLPLKALEPIEDRSGRAAHLRAEAARLVALANALEVSRG